MFTTWAFLVSCFQGGGGGGAKQKRDGQAVKNSVEGLCFMKIRLCIGMATIPFLRGYSLEKDFRHLPNI